MKFTGKGFKNLSEKNIFEKITGYDIFKCYIPEFEAINKPFCSPLRKDRNPSCSIQEWNGEYIYKDFATGEAYYPIKFVQTKFNCKYFEALNIISADFDLGLHSRTIERTSMDFIGIRHIKQESVPKETKIRIKRRSFNDTIDKDYWNLYGLNTSILRHFNVFPIQTLWINDKVINIKDNNPSYAYIFDKGKYKIMSPFNEYKWVNNCDSSYIQGWKQLPNEGELLIITSSLKDVMVLYKLGYSAIAPQSETTLIDIDTMSQLKERFGTIVVLFDNDKAGIEAAEMYESLYEIDMIIIPEGEEKDPSAYYKKWGLNPTKKLLKELL